VTDELEGLLADLLRAHPAGQSEFQLLRCLQERLPGLFPAGLFGDSLALFQAHFLLFHVLYRLRDRWAAAGQGMLQIDVLRIVLWPPGPAAGRGALAAPDPLRDYYLDLANLEDTDAAGVERLLGAFWARYYARERRAAALRELGLSDPVGRPEIVRRYRRLAMRHHPDRGGEAARFRAIRAALEVLRRCS
jgi:hypothetical protein